MRPYFLVFLFFPNFGFSQVDTDSAAFFLRDIYRQVYMEEKAFTWLTTLTKDIGHRLSGSENAEKAVDWAVATMDTFGLDSVWKQPVMVPKWVRGDNEQVILLSKSLGAHTLMGYALGNSPGTGPKGIRAEVIEVKSLDELRAMPDEKVAGKIVFFSRPMDMGMISMFGAYGNAADQRGSGPLLASTKGAVAAVVRSIASREDDYPHTGATHLSENGTDIPSVALSTKDATFLSNALKQGPAELSIYTYCGMQGEVLSHNVIGEIRGSEFPEEIILIGGHLDSWDVGEGAHDDGAGCVHSMEVMYRLVKNGYKPKRTIRCVLFMNEENGLKGAKKYAEEAIAKKEFHLAAIESDGGGATAQGFGCAAGDMAPFDSTLAFMGTYTNLLEPYDLEIKTGGGGADIGFLKPTAAILIGLRPDNARYFDYHHSDLDVLENVHPRELASGSAALTSLIFLIDQYGLGL